jgi:hypothetical protein
VARVTVGIPLQVVLVVVLGRRELATPTTSVTILAHQAAASTCGSLGGAALGL